MSTNWNQQPDQNDPSQQAGYGSQPSADPYAQPSAGTYGAQPSADPYAQPSADPYAQPSTPNYGYDQGQYAQQQYDPYAQQNPYQQNPYGYQQNAYQPYGAVAVPGAPYGVDPRTGLPYSSKSKLAAGLLQIFVGGLGIGRFYTGHYGIAIAQIAVTLVTFGVGAIWPLIDGILMLTGEPKDSDGYPLRPN